jgi:hypothetical protein
MYYKIRNCGLWDLIMWSYVGMLVLYCGVAAVRGGYVELVVVRWRGNVEMVIVQ